MSPRLRLVQLVEQQQPPPRRRLERGLDLAIFWVGMVLAFELLVFAVLG